jgi:uncharacterized protein (DUF1697 family)
MEQRVALLRGINLGPHKRVAMPALRELLAEAGFEQVRTYVQSGNVVVASDAAPESLARELEALIADRLGFEVEVIVRTEEDLAQVVKRNPLAKVAVEPKRYQVTFLAEELEPRRLEQLAGLAAPSEQFVAKGRELYAWHPDGVARSKLWAKLGSTGLGVKGTSRNWSTVTTLLAMMRER